jgi:hypothetical protein
MLFLLLILLIIGGLYNTLSAQVSPETQTQTQVTPDAQGYKMAVGIRFSTASPTINNSISFKYFIDQTNAIEGLASFGSRFGLGGLYERHQLIGATPAFTWF